MGERMREALAKRDRVELREPKKEACAFDGKPWVYKMTYVKGAETYLCSIECLLKWANEVKADEDRRGR